jgi:hypothetical protein
VLLDFAHELGNIGQGRVGHLLGLRQRSQKQKQKQKKHEGLKTRSFMHKTYPGEGMEPEPEAAHKNILLDRSAINLS